MAGLERELVMLQSRAKILEDSYSDDLMVLTVTKCYLGTLLGDAKILRWLTKQHPEYLKEFERIADMDALPGFARVPSNGARHVPSKSVSPPS